MQYSQFRQTVATSFQVTGITLHSGIQATLTVSPNTHGTGILFGDIPAIYTNVVHTRNATVISNGTHTISTIEHMVSALYACQIHDAILHCEQAEVPIMDGGAKDFVDAIQSVGMVATNYLLQVLKITDTLTTTDEKGGFFTFSPYDGFYVDVGIDFQHPVIGQQYFKGDICPEVYATDIAPARTFGFLDQLLHYQKYDLARGASTDTAVVFDTDKPLNSLRFDDEPIRHKVLDIIGDIALCGYPIQGKITAHKMGHQLNNQALYTLFKNPHAYSIL